MKVESEEPVVRPWSVELVRVGAAAPATLRRLREDMVSILAHAVWVAERTMNPAPAFDPHRRQYNATTLLVMLNDLPVVPDVIRVGVTDVDLFLPVFTHVFGAAQLDGTAGIASCHRLRPELTAEMQDAALLRSRLLKEVLHELGHTLGLTHCRTSWCAMAASRVAEEVDLKDPTFCDPCAERVGVPPNGSRSFDLFREGE